MPESHGRFVSCLKRKRMLWFGKVSKLNRENQMKTIEIFAEAVKFASEASDIPSDRYCRRAAMLTLWTQECSLYRRFMT